MLGDKSKNTTDCKNIIQGHNFKEKFDDSSEWDRLTWNSPFTSFQLSCAHRNCGIKLVTITKQHKRNITSMYIHANKNTT